MSTKCPQSLRNVNLQKSLKLIFVDGKALKMKSNTFSNVPKCLEMSANVPKFQAVILKPD